MSCNRALVLVAGFGGGHWTFEAFVKDEKERETFRKIFGEENIISPLQRAGNDVGALDRARDTISEIRDRLSGNAKITICTYSGGGFVVRCLMSLLRSEEPDLYDRVELVTIEDGAIRGAYVPPSYLIASVLGQQPKRCSINIPLPAVHADLATKLGREICVGWPLNIDTHRDDDEWWDGIAKMGNHPSRAQLLNRLEELDQGRHWGEGAYTAGYSNGGTEFFERSEAEMRFVKYRGKAFAGSAELEVEFGCKYLKIHPSGLACFACLKGSKIGRLKVEFTKRYGAWAMAPGCYQSARTGVKRALEVAKYIEDKADGYFATKVLESTSVEVAYIHTTSSLDIDEDPFYPYFARDEPELLKEKSSLNEAHFRGQNQAHWDAWYRQDNLERVKEGPPST